MFTLQFWRAVLDRAIKTGAEFVLAVLGVAGYSATQLHTESGELLNALTWNWLTLGGAFLSGALLAVLMNLATASATDGNPSLTDAEVLLPTVQERLSPPPAPRARDTEGPDHLA
jgi:hypothetical protein